MIVEIPNKDVRNIVKDLNCVPCKYDATKHLLKQLEDRLRDAGPNAGY